MTDPRVIATRRYFTSDGTTVTAQLFEPMQADTELWTCEFAVSGLGEEIRGKGHGVDSLQAIRIGMDGLRWHLEKSAEPLTMGPAEDGYEAGHLGIPRWIPDSYGLEIEKKLRALVEAETTRLVREGVASRRQKKQR